MLVWGGFRVWCVFWLFWFGLSWFGCDLFDFGCGFGSFAAGVVWCRL